MNANPHNPAKEGSSCSELRTGVAELEGLYGSFTVSERVIQQVWLHQDFDHRDLTLESGESLEVIDPGVWNHLEGPDFKDAEVRINGRTLKGDVELHLYPEDWNRHGHSSDSAYRRVVLHVTLFAPSGVPSGRVLVGGSLPLLVLLPHLDEDVEAVLMRNAVKVEGDPDWREHPWMQGFLFGDDGICRLSVLRSKGLVRWKQKVGYAVRRLEKNAWDAACHQIMLEVMGFRRNRAPMHELAFRYPLESWEKGSIDPAAMFAEAGSGWILTGVRPHNHPLRRLESYARWVHRHQHWPESFYGACRDLWKCQPAAARDTKQYRRETGLVGLSRHFREGFFDGLFGESRHATLWCDGLLPLLAARTGCLSLHEPWFHWYVGDMPGWVQLAAEAVIRMEPDTDIVQCNGLSQGLLELALEYQSAASS